MQLQSTLASDDVGVVTAPSAVYPVTQRQPLLATRLRSAWETILGTGFHGAWIGLWSAVGLAGTLAAPFLLDQPLLLMALAPRALFVGLAAPGSDFLAFVIIGLIRLGIADASYFILGRRFPERTVSKKIDGLPRWRRLAALGCHRLVTMISSTPLTAFLALFIRPSGRYLAVAGSYGVSPRLAGWSSVLGTVTYLVAVHQGLGFLFP